MRSFDEIDKRELRDVLVRNWMTHDATWFATTAQRCGIEQANGINRAAVKAMAVIEARRLQKLFGVAAIDTFDDLREFIQATFELIRAPFMEFAFTFPEPNVMRWDVVRCFAYEGVSRLGFIEQYQCGIADRLDGWFETLGVRYTVTPDVDGCLWHAHGACARIYRFHF